VAKTPISAGPAVSTRKLLVWRKSYSSSSVCCIGLELGSLRNAMPPNMCVLSRLVFIDIGLTSPFQILSAYHFQMNEERSKSSVRLFIQALTLANYLNTSVFFAHPRVVSNGLFNHMGVGCASRRMGRSECPPAHQLVFHHYPRYRRLGYVFHSWVESNADGVMTLVSIIVQSFFAWSANEFS
jgi:hypothetical protein